MPNSNIKFSLILATIGRDEEVGSFLKSLEKQSYKNFELIIIDQNQDNKIDNIVERYKENFFITHIKIKEKGLSLARNIGLNYVKGDIIAFPDDDCEYPPNLLSKVHELFLKFDEFNVLTGISIDKKAKKISSGNFLKKKSEITSKNIFKSAISFTIFIKIKSNDPPLLFDEKLGVGADFGSAEETDYLYRLIKKGYKGFFNPEEILVYHPCKMMNIEEEIKKAHSYGMGMGAFFKKHLIRERDFSLIKVFFLLFLIRPIGGILSGLLKLNYKISLLYINVLVARWKGLVKY
jgi:glycosyltransferase involved in cell wall biosynthesis